MARLPDSHSPNLVLTFESFAFEFARRSQEDTPPPLVSYTSRRRFSSAILLGGPARL